MHFVSDRANQRKRNSVKWWRAAVALICGVRRDLGFLLRLAGITRQLIPAQRPERQMGACTRYYGPQFLLGGKCIYKWLWIGVGCLQAGTIEASYTLLYAITHKGNCPPGMPASV